jgi:hypothetical protein
LPKMSPLALSPILSSARASAVASMSDSKLQSERSDAMDYYNGIMQKDLPAQEGRSKAVSSDVADVIDGVMPQLVDIFVGGDQVVQFDPVGPEDEEAAQQETDYVNHVFMQQNDGFTTAHHFIKDGLLEKVGFVKVFWEKFEREERETYYDQSPEQFAMIAQFVLASDGAAKIIEHTENEDGSHDVTLLNTKKVERARVLGVPPEEVGIERAARNLKDCNYFFHDIVTKTEGDLIAEGFDETMVRALPGYTGALETETLARDTAAEHEIIGSTGDLNRASRLVAITEHYIRLDYEQNGKPALYMIITAGRSDGRVLMKDGEDCVYPIDAIPFAAAIPLPVPHRFIGRSLADKTMDIQRIKTALLRGALDNTYLHNAPRPVVSEAHAGPNTIDDLLTVRQGAPIRVKQPGGIEWQVIPDITPSIFPMMQYMDGLRESRTGMSKQAQGLDANALQNQSATAVAQVFSESQMQLKLLARNIAEGFKDMFSLLHATIRKHGQQAQTVRLRNSWVQVDPRQWKTRDDMTIHVGLGTGSKAQQYAQIMGLANFQKELIMGGKAHMVPDAQLFNTASELVKLTGHKNPDKFFADPSAKDPQTGQPLHPPQPVPPDPKVMAIQAQAQNDQQELAMKAQLDQQKAKDAAALAQFKAEIDAKLKIIDAHIKAVEAERKMRSDQQAHHAHVATAVVDVIADAHKHDMAMAHEQQMHDQKMDQAETAHQAKLQQMKQKPAPKGNGK